MSELINELVYLPLEKQKKVLKKWSKQNKDSIEINGDVFLLPSVVIGLIRALTDELEEMKKREYAIQEN